MSAPLKPDLAALSKAIEEDAAALVKLRAACRRLKIDAEAILRALRVASGREQMPESLFAAPWEQPSAAK